MAPNPTVGRIVMFKTRGSADGVYPPRDFAAIITRVYEDGDISVASFGETGMRFEVKISQGNEGGQWNWPVRTEGALTGPGITSIPSVGGAGLGGNA